MPFVISDSDLLAGVRDAAKKLAVAGEILTIKGLRRHGAKGGDCRIKAAIDRLRADGEMDPAGPVIRKGASPLGDVFDEDMPIRTPADYVQEYAFAWARIRRLKSSAKPKRPPAAAVTAEQNPAKEGEAPCLC
jgi:hypothetical protein